jgi:cobalt-zinc-cadmium efflux system outer membrane protein
MPPVIEETSERNGTAVFTWKGQLMNFAFARILAICLLVLSSTTALAQEQPAQNQPEKLVDLLAEAEHNNPQIQAARNAWEAAKKVPSQVSTLPDPEIMVQQFSVGSPRPFAGYTNSDFAYVGLGFSQDIPYPGKLRLRGAIAKKDSEVFQQNYEAVSREILSELKARYFRLAFLAKKNFILEGDGKLLRQVKESAEARYRTGTGNQQEVLQAQLEQTKLLREVTLNELEIGKVQSGIKNLLNRPQSVPDIEAIPLAETPLPYTYDQLLEAANSGSPQIEGTRKIVDRQKLQVELAKKDFYPDFNVQYMWQRTDPSQYRAYYMLTFGIRIPIYRTRKQRPELAQAELEESRARSDLQAKSQEVASALREQYVTAEKSAELLKIYREGLLPQARAELQAGMAAYQSNRQDFQALLASFLDVLKLDEEYWQTLSEHETALAQIEETTGLSLR